jgi:hypothetical protein
VEVVAAFAPVSSFPFTQNVRLVFVVVNVEVETYWNLPADFGFPINEVFASRLSGCMERAAGPARKSGSVEENASTFMTACDPISVIFMDRSSEACRHLFELPFVITKTREDFSDSLAVLFV